MARVFILFFILVPFTTFAVEFVGHEVPIELKGQPINQSLRPFITDGCTAYPNGTKEQPDLWLSCCIQHDFKYWLGGTQEEKSEADKELYSCVKALGSPYHALIMYVGVLFGGRPTMDKAYRWGYGWSRIRGYSELTPEEFSMAENMYGENLIEIKELIKNHKIPIQSLPNDPILPDFGEDFCEEQVAYNLINSLNKRTTVVFINKQRKLNHFWADVYLDICPSPVRLTFTPYTSPNTCKIDYALTDSSKNQIQKVEIPPLCEGYFDY